MKIKAAVSYEFDKPLVIDEIDLADPRANEILVKVAGVGICATDIGCIKDGLGGFNKLPMVFGHEGSGVVEKVGPGVTEFNVGDHVVLSYPYCGKCENCLSGRPWFCSSLLPLIHGGGMEDGYSPLSKNGERINNYFGTSCFASHLVSNVKNAVKVDPEVNITDLGPLGCGFVTGAGAVLNALEAKAGNSIAVFGLGAIGQSAIMAAKIAGCYPIVAVDIFDEKLESAKIAGATHTINSKNIEDVAGEIKKITNGGAYYSIEGAGVEATVKAALACLRDTGKMASIAVSGKVNFEGFFFATYGKSIHSIDMGNVHPKLFIPKLVEWHKRGLFPLGEFIKYYALEDINQAIADSKSGKVVKPVIRFE